MSLQTQRAASPPIAPYPTRQSEHAPAPTIETVRIDLGDRGYDIRIGSGLLSEAASFEGLPASHAAFVVTNTTVAPLYLDTLCATLSTRHASIGVVTLGDGESTKTWASLNQIFDAFLGAACDRKTVVYALGGGVIGDLTGFAAACYMRGVPFVQVPTTLLAQVDSSVGGKTAINHPLGKNMIGAFYQPLQVVADLSTLATLPRREVQAGLAEIIKYGPIADMAFFEWLELHVDDLLAGDASALMHAVKRSCEIKAFVVGQDERESGLRAILNFGHTFGHAIEAGLGYGVWLHGEAVACGMVMAADLSQRLGLVDAGIVERLTRLLDRAGLPIVGPALGADRYLEAMQIDKKTEGGSLRFVLLDGPGRACVRGAPTELVRAVIEAHTA